MTAAKTYAWILLSVSASGSTRRAISEMADAIQHAVPTHLEMETSLQWLQERGLVRGDGRRFARTGAGEQLLERFRSPTRPILQTWELLSGAIEEMLEG
jgi:hypothetical protein